MRTRDVPTRPRPALRSPAGCLRATSMLTLAVATVLMLAVPPVAAAPAASAPAADPPAAAARPAAAEPPAGFTDALLARVPAPTAVAFVPDGRVLVTSQPGQLRVLRAGSLLPAPALDLAPVLCANSERGLLGVAVSPTFSTDSYIYLYYTFRRVDCSEGGGEVPVNRMSRFVLGAGDRVVPGSESVLVDGIPSFGGNHNAGDVQFGKDGNLYVSVGDGGCDYAGGGCAGANDAARDRHVLLGKILRITPAGGIPADNPFRGPDSASCAATGRTTPGRTCQETYAWGLRNPFRIASDPDAAGTRFLINDVGQDTWEEVDELVPGADYGWNVREGPCARGSSTNCGPPPAGMTNPVFSYHHDTGCRSLSGGAFVPAGRWPGYDGAYLYADYVCGRIFALRAAAGGGYRSEVFATGVGSVVTLAFGPYLDRPALYYTRYDGGGELRVVTGPAGPGSPGELVRRGARPVGK
jgi:glucose/arabinose dehydrogenase